METTIEKKRKLSDVLKEIFSTPNTPHLIDEYVLYGDILKNHHYGKMIFSCEEFSDVDSIEIVDCPMYTKKEKSFSVQNIKLTEGLKFKGKIHLFSIGLTSEIYDISCLTRPVLENGAISTTIYNAENFTPNKIISLFFNPEFAQDSSVKTVTVFNNKGEKKEKNEFKEYMHELLDKILDNPEKYQSKGVRHVMIRGHFEEMPKGEFNPVKISI